MTFMEYRCPEEETGRMGPQRSTNTRSKGTFAFSPSLTFDTGDRVCFPRIQGLHLGGEEERLMVIPSAAPCLAMSTMAPTLQCPKRRCQVSTSGVREAYNAVESKSFSVLDGRMG